MSQFFRVCHIETQQGLWYCPKGNFAGLIHNEFSFCKNRDLKMEFDSSLVGWLSATPNLIDLYNWFSEEDIRRLQEHNYFIHVYESDEHKFYERFSHAIIKQSASRVVSTIKL